MVSVGPKIPAHIPEASEFALKAARRLGGMAGSLITEVLFNIPATAHCMGGAGMGRSAADGVVDVQSRVFAYKNMLVCDGSTLSSNLGVNPSLTITAISEHAMSFIPDKQAPAITAAKAGVAD
jgi:cholesterol oxidase